MRRIASVAGLGLLLTASLALAQPYRSFDLPKFTEPPILDGDRFTVSDEWANTLGPLECSPAQIQRDGEQFGWLDQATKNTVVSHDQLSTSENEDGAVATTVFDKMSNTWQAWDDDALYYIHEVRDNVRDVEGSGEAQYWWERDSVSIYIDLTEANEPSAPYVSLNIVNMVAAPRNSSAVTVMWERTEAGARSSTMDPELVGDIDYGFQAVGDAFGGEEDFVIEAMVPWETFMLYNLPAKPEPGTVMGWSWLYVDPDGDPGYGGQLQCWGHADNPITFADFVFTDTPAGPGTGTAVEEDSWGMVKATFNQ